MTPSDVDIVDLLHPGPLVPVNPAMLRKYRQWAGFTVDELADAAGLDPRTVVRLEDELACHSANIRWPQCRHLTLKRLAKVLAADERDLRA